MPFRSLQRPSRGANFRHSSRLIFPEEWLAEAVQQANRLHPDIVALTGDFVTYSRANIEPAAEILSRLRARYGVFAVLGNHDFRVDADA